MSAITVIGIGKNGNECRVEISAADKWKMEICVEEIGKYYCIDNREVNACAEILRKLRPQNVFINQKEMHSLDLIIDRHRRRVGGFEDEEYRDLFDIIRELMRKAIQLETSV